MLFYQTVESEFGILHVYATKEHLRAITFDQNHMGIGLALGLVDSRSNPHIESFIQQLTEYCQGERTVFDLALDIQGTPFQKQVWSMLREIPYAQTLSYAQQAQQMGRPKAVRAVANANGRNRFPIVIPCHRVIGSNQALGGYSGGIETKKRLLALEQIFTSSRTVFD